MVFFGEYLISFTGKGRLVLPKKIREHVKGNAFVLTKGFDKCLAGYDQSDWEERAKELLSVSLLDKDQLDKRRFIFSSATIIEIDEQGRFVIPKAQLQIVGSGKKVIVIGVGDHFEFWNPEEWEQYQSSIES